VALEQNGAVLEDDEFDLPLIATPDGVNEGAFYGIGRETAEIAKFMIQGPYAVVDDSFTTPVPEPSTYAMPLGILGLLGFMARRGARSQSLQRSPRLACGPPSRHPAWTGHPCFAVDHSDAAAPTGRACCARTKIPEPAMRVTLAARLAVVGATTCRRVRRRAASS
jgi:hypothetical protein